MLHVINYIANYINEYFFTVSKESSDKIPSQSKDACEGKDNKQIFLNLTTEDEILAIILKFNIDTKRNQIAEV